MHITIITLGSRGDVQPCVALGLGLKQAGYQVRIATYDLFADLVNRCSLEFASVHGDPRQIIEGESGQKLLESNQNPVKWARNLQDLIAAEGVEKTLADIVKACQGVDAILYTIFGIAGHHVAEMLDVPSMAVFLQPASRTREFPCFLFPAFSLGGGYNRWTYRVLEEVYWQMMRLPTNRWRRESLKLEPLPFWGMHDILYQKRVPWLYGFSQFVVPRPHDWPDWHHITGYWFLDGVNDWSPPTGLVDFLASGPKPVCVGFGSMSGRVTRRLSNLAIEAITMSKQRAVLLGGWAQAHKRDLPDHIYAIESAPHDWLFPRMAAVVHHGGAGTTAAGLRAGVPSVVTPFNIDQPYWGRRVHALGAGPKPVLCARATTKRLADTIIQAVTDPSIKRQAIDLGKKIRAEDGAAKAVEIVNQYVSRSKE